MLQRLVSFREESDQQELLCRFFARLVLSCLVLLGRTAVMERKKESTRWRSPAFGLALRIYTARLRLFVFLFVYLFISRDTYMYVRMNAF